jgi:tRNA pseudouridine38-40 synthase
MTTRSNISYGKYLLEIAYSGTEFFGWQVQPNEISVQQVIEKKLSTLYNCKITIRGAGRTDSGVHAVGMTATFHIPAKPFIPENKLRIALNSILPETIFIRNVSTVSTDFDPRFDALGKAYTYIISPSELGPFTNQWCWKVPYKFDITKIKEATQYLIGEHDFTSFAVAINKTKKNPIRKIYRINVNQYQNYVCLTFIGESFLYKMVRSLAGAIVQCSDMKKEPGEIKKILDAKDRRVAYKTAPPHGLFLMKVFYDQYEMDNYELKEIPFFSIM